ncbi:hypothetical protein [Carboxylicivirga sp. N1Y90]|uniref:hypothetical protein n=1 Tax=Carboxylicivirga fragile TaxID=3417571 RepID=UPI003D3263C1|nr:NAD(P)H-binding protein [Marinilabiliaceae bacterium N1Y90]
MNQKVISVLGCGWLGFPLAKALNKGGWYVKGSTTSPEKQSLLEANNIKPYVLQLGEAIGKNEFADFLDSEYLIVNVPPSKGLAQTDSYAALINALSFSGVKKLVLVSSTSVYENTNSVVKEEDTDSMDGDANRMLVIERLFQSLRNIDVTVVRFAGLIGPERHPGGFFGKGRIVKGAKVPINLIHLDDCIGIIKTVIDKEIWGNVFNGCASTHPKKEDFYSKATSIKGNPAPVFDASNLTIPYKIVSNDKVKSILDYEFVYDDLMKMLDVDNFA